MQEQDQHTMVLAAEFSDGSQEWLCPTCGRRFIIQWPPNYKRTILEEGDPQAIHSGGTNGLSMGEAAAEPSDALLEESMECPDCPGEPVEIDESYLEPFKAWLEQRADL